MESEGSFMNLPPIREFDAFPKTLPTYKQRSTRGGFTTIGIFLLISWLVWHELQEYFFGEPKWSFDVEKDIGHWLQINLDMTIAMPCHCELGGRL
jgi:endoplasmic reticulum-Golgi intermediate compartment protein 2